MYTAVDVVTIHDTSASTLCVRCVYKYKFEVFDSIDSVRLALVPSAGSLEIIFLVVDAGH